MLAHFAVRIKMGRSYVRVSHEGVTKGSFVEHVIKHYNNRGGVDMLFIIADDVADEDIFKVAAAYHRDVLYRLVSNSTTLQQVKVFTCTVGRQPSSASYCLFNAEEVLELMGGLYLLNKRIKRRARVATLDSPSGSRSPSYRSSPRGSPVRSSPHSSRGRVLSAASHSGSLSPVTSPARSREPSPFPMSPGLSSLPCSPPLPPTLPEQDTWPAEAHGRSPVRPPVRDAAPASRRGDVAGESRLALPETGSALGTHLEDDSGETREVRAGRARSRHPRVADSQPVTQMVREKVRGRKAVGGRADSGNGRQGWEQGSLREWEVQQQRGREDLSPDWTHPWRDWSPGEGRVR
jgi:hypothetical protein